jgi:Tol biopolymer transport system component
MAARVRRRQILCGSCRHPAFLRPVHVLVALATLSSAAATAQSRKLSGSLARAFGGDVRDLQVTPDGTWAVFLANPASDAFALYSVPTRGGTPVLVAAEHVDSGTRFQLTPDGRFVVYARLYAQPYEERALYLAPIDGSREPAEIAEDASRFQLVPDGSGVVYLGAQGLYALSFASPAAALPLTGPLPPDARILELQVGPDGLRVVYTHSCAGGTGNVALSSVPLDGGQAPVELSASAAPGLSVSSFSVSADGSRVVFLARADGGGTVELWSVPIDGGSAAVKLNGPLPPQGNVTSFRLGPDGLCAVYLADQEVDERIELYGVPIGGGVAVRLNGALTARGDVARFEITPDGRSVLYLADAQRDEQGELYLAAIEGGAAPARVGGPSAGIGAFRLGADGRRVVFATRRALHAASFLRPGEALLLADGLDPASLFDFQLGADGRAVYRDDGLFSVPIDASAGPRRLDDGGHVESGFLIAPDGTVLYQADRDVAGVHELFGVPSDGRRAPYELGPDMDAGQVIGDVSAAWIAPGGQAALYAVEVPGCCDGTHDELYSVRVGALARPIRLFPGAGFTNDDDLRCVQLTPDGSRVVFTVGDDAGESTYFLHSIPIDGRGELARLNDPAGLDYGLRSFVIGPNGSTVFYVQDGVHAGLCRVAADGSSPPSLLPESASASGDSTPFELAADGSRLVFVSDPLEPGADALFSVRADGSEPAVELDRHGTTPFRVTPDGLRVVYLAAPEGSTFELFGVAIDGSTEPVRLSGALVPGGDVDHASGFALTPDGSHVVYLADAVTDGVFELFSAPTDGGAAPVRLDPASALERSAADPPFRLAPDGSRVVYRSDRRELYAVPIDGAAEPVRLDGTSGGHVSSFQIGADGARVVYRADPAEAGVFELFSVAIDAGAPAIQLTGPHAAEGSVLEVFRITPDGKQVVFGADHDARERHELYAAPLDGSKRARKLNGPLVADGDVLNAARLGYGLQSVFRVAPDSERVLYLADQDADDVVELYESSLGPARPRGPGRAAPFD